MRLFGGPGSFYDVRIFRTLSQSQRPGPPLHRASGAVAPNPWSYRIRTQRPWYRYNSSACSRRTPKAHCRRMAMNTRPPTLMRRSIHATCPGRIPEVQPVVFLNSSQPWTPPGKQYSASGTPCPVDHVSTDCQWACVKRLANSFRKPPSRTSQFLAITVQDISSAVYVFY